MTQTNEVDMDFSKYLTEDEMREIAEQEFRSVIRNKANKDLERIINNSAYSVIWKAVDESLNNEAINILKQKVVDIINNMSEFTVFSKPNAWDRQENTAYGILMQTVRDNSNVLDIKVKDQINALSKTQISKIVTEVMKEKVGKVL